MGIMIIRTPKKYKRESARWPKLLDVALLAVIVISAVFILRSLYRPQKDIDGGVKNEFPVVSETQQMVVREARKGALEESLHISDDQWSKLRAQMSQQIAQETLGCESGRANSRAIYFFDFDISAKVAADKFRTIWVFSRHNCYKKGSKILLLNGGFRPSDAYIRLIGETEILDVVRGPVRRFPDSLFQSIGLDRARLETFDFDHPKEGSVFALLRLKEVRPGGDLSPLPPLQFPSTTVLTGAEAKAAVQNPNSILLDVRSPSEFAARSLPRSINVPFGRAPMRFVWTKKMDDVTRSQFEVARLLPDKNKTIVVYGSERSDGRAFWALAELYRNDFRKLVWLPDGIPALD